MNSKLRKIRADKLRRLRILKRYKYTYIARLEKLINTLKKL